MKAKIEVEEDIPFLDIPKGVYDLQRLFYYKFCKAFYYEEYTLKEMNHINFDWHQPQNCYRHTPEKIEQFCKDSNLKIERIHTEESGISVLASKLN